MKQLLSIVLGFVLIFSTPVIVYSAIEDGKCKEGLVLVTKINGNLACVKPTSVYPLLQRGWASHEQTDTAQISLDVAGWFVKSSPTFVFDGIEDSLDLQIESVRESFPEQYVIECRIY